MFHLLFGFAPIIPYILVIVESVCIMKQTTPQQHVSHALKNIHQFTSGRKYETLYHYTDPKGLVPAEACLNLLYL